MEKKITVPDCNVKVIRELKKYIEEHVEKTGRFPKTLIFASNDLPNRSHADEIVEICKKEFNQGDDFVCKITGSPTVDRPLQKCKLRQALIKDKRFKELYLLPAAQTRDKSAVNEEQMIRLTNELKEKFDYILIDCPAGIEQGFKNAIAGANRAIVVSTAEISSIRDADRIIGLLESSEIKNPELVINRIRPNMVRRGEMMDVDDIVDLLSIDLIGVVPDDEYIITQTNKGEPVIQNKKAPSGKAYMEIAKRVLGEKIEVTIPGREKGFWAKIKKLFRK